MAIGNKYRPDYVAPPGLILREHLEARGQSPEEFARDCDRSPEFIRGLLAGESALDEATAQRFEDLLNLRAYIWLRCEAGYRRHLSRQAEARRVAATSNWSESFPIKELVKRGAIEKPESEADAVFRLLHFFEVWTPAEWQEMYGAGSVIYSRLPQCSGETARLAAWRRIGELEAEWQRGSDYNAASFLDALTRIRRLTGQPPVAVWPQAVQLCNDAGVVLTLVKPFAALDLRGSAWRLSSRQAIIQLGNPRQPAGRLWQTFFHAAAHLLLHSNPCDGNFFIDPDSRQNADVENEANRWVSDFLLAAASA